MHRIWSMRELQIERQRGGGGAGERGMEGEREGRRDTKKGKKGSQPWPCNIKQLLINRFSPNLY